MLAELGCSYAEVGHADRRRLFGEDDATIAAKARAAARAGLTPVVCVGETERPTSGGAALACRAQIEPVLVAVEADADVVFAYEPEGAVGGDAPAPAEHVAHVAHELCAAFAGRPGRTRLLYGGSARPGLFASLAGYVDGLVLGASRTESKFERRARRGRVGDDPPADRAALAGPTGASGGGRRQRHISAHQGSGA
jgi:triosephosphate isomerase (TIM)